MYKFGYHSKLEEIEESLVQLDILGTKTIKLFSKDSSIQEMFMLSSTHHCQSERQSDIDQLRME